MGLVFFIFMIYRSVQITTEGGLPLQILGQRPGWSVFEALFSIQRKLLLHQPVSSCRVYHTPALDKRLLLLSLTLCWFRLLLGVCPSER